MKQFKRLSIVIITILLSLSSLFGQNAGDLFFADESIYYGDESFRARMLERTKGERSPVGLVLSGGSARAFAHIGVLELLEEEGIVPDYIVSNSMGSIVGMLYAAGLSPIQIREAIANISVQTLFDITLPIRGGLLEPSRFLSYAAKILGGSPDLRELPIPIIVLTEDLVTRRQVAISEGDFLTVLQASFALPVYFEPVEYRGHLLIDGGVTNLVPVEVAYEYSDTVIISTTFYDVDTLNLRNPLTILNVTLDIGKRRQGVHELKERLDEAILIRNAVENISFMEFDEVNFLAQKGYESASLMREELKALSPGEFPDLTLLRATYQKSLDAVIERYHYFKHMPMVQYNDLLGIELTQYTNKRLTNEMTLGLSYSLNVGNFRLQTNLGYSFGLATRDYMASTPTFSAEIEYYPFSFLRAAVNGTVGFQQASNLSLFELSSVVEGGLYTWKEQLRLNFALSFEYLGAISPAALGPPVFWGYHQYWLGNQTFLYFAALGELDLKQRDVPWHLLPTHLELDYQLLSQKKIHRSFLYFDSASGVIHRPTGLFGELQLWGRFAVDGKGDVPLLPTDSYRTLNASLQSQGRDLTAASVNPVPFLIGLNTTIGWKPFKNNISVAETLLFKDFSIGIYSDLLFSTIKAAPNVNLGVELCAEVSLLGIKSLPATFYVGWDEANNGVVWGFLLTLGL